MRARISTDLVLCSVMAIAAIALGGATRAGFPGDVVLQFLAVALISCWAWRPQQLPSPPAMRAGLAFFLALIVLHCIQLIPLPPAVWTRLPGREAVVASLEVSGNAARWLPLSLVPQSTWVSLLALAPPLAMFMGVARLGYAERRSLSLVVIAGGLISAFLGLLQVAQGAGSPLRLYQQTNLTEAVGLFANRNHFSALIYSVLLLVGAWAAAATETLRADKLRQLLATRALIPITGCFIALFLLVAAEAMARSRAGLGLTMVALAGTMGLVLVEQRSSVASGRARLVAGGLVLVVLLAVQAALYRILERFGGDPLEDARIGLAENTVRAAWAHMPFGSGMGSFVEAFALVERPRDLLATYANRAHDDVLEYCLEGGAPLVVLMAVFGVWLAISTYRAWVAAPGARSIDRALPRAASVIIWLILLHSLVDYPLRTAAMMVLVAAACGLLIAPVASAADDWEPATEPSEVRQRSSPAAAADARQAAPRALADIGPGVAAAWPIQPQQVDSGAQARQTIVWPQMADAGAQQSQPAWPSTEAPASNPGGAPGAGAKAADIEWPDEWRQTPAMPTPEK